MSNKCKCDPADACATHGRCWTHSEWLYPESPLETALVFDTEGKTLYWHLPDGRSAGGLPDSQELWDVLYEHRAVEKGGTGRLGGVAHTHPWFGSTGYSGIDQSTYAALETGLGLRLLWPIATFDCLHYFVWQGPERGDYVEVFPEGFVLEGLEELRLHSGAPGNEHRTTE